MKRNNIKNKQFEIQNGTTMTVPDEAMSVREILERHARGITTPMERRRKYGEQDSFDAEDLDEIMNSDYMDKDEFIKNVRRKENEAKSELSRKQQAKAKALEEANAKKRPIEPPAPTEKKASNENKEGGETAT